MIFRAGKQKTPRGVFCYLFLCFLESDVFSENLAVFLQLDFLFDGLFVLAGHVDFSSLLVSQNDKFIL